MTTENKAKAYDEALKKAKEIKSKILSSHLSTESCKAISEYIDEIIPELAESEDERIINQLITLVNSTGEVLLIPTNKEELVSWLNKCKESLHISETCKENADSFTDEDEKIRKALINIVKGACGKYGIKCRADKVTEEKLFSYLEKQKDLDKMIVVSPEVWDKAINDAYENGKKDNEKQKEQKPVDLSEMMVHKEPYIAPVPTPMVADEQKPAEWSEEDEEMRKLLIAILEVNHPDGFFKANELGTTDMRGVHTEEIVSWLKSLPERFNLQPKQEWSEKDEKMIERLITRLNWITYNTRTDGTSPNITFFDEIDWLKSLRPSWKPSEEQIKAIESCFCEFGEGCPDEDGLRSLYNDLKKLM